jgi:hypothetical protein
MMVSDAEAPPVRGRLAAVAAWLADAADQSPGAAALAVHDARRRKTVNGKSRWRELCAAGLIQLRGGKSAATANDRAAT